MHPCTLDVHLASIRWLPCPSFPALACMGRGAEHGCCVHCGRASIFAAAEGTHVCCKHEAMGILAAVFSSVCAVAVFRSWLECDAPPRRVRCHPLHLNSDVNKLQG